MEDRMKNLALTTLLTLAIGAYTPARSQGPYDKRADAHKDIQTALTEAQADGKLVLLDFGANWCLDCIVLSHLYEDETVHPFLDANFHVVRSEEHTSELQSLTNLVCRLLLEKKNPLMT